MWQRATEEPQLGGAAMLSVKQCLRDISNRFKAETNYIVEQGTSGKWTYRKWSDGTSECWTKFQLGDKQTSTEGSVYWSNHGANFPASLFVDTPVVNVDIGGNWISGATLTTGLTRSVCTFYVWTAANPARSLLTAYVKAVGRWK